ncbi:MAG TPA: phosphoribosylglycinamide formyltransferase, partial [Stenotrophomonas sp.]|nr:phosphoribosylglycinamide formyltransferase [Stenotrophomonas sp.]
MGRARRHAAGHRRQPAGMAAGQAGAAMNAPARIAVLASGRGSNLQCLLDGIAVGQLHARIAGVFSDKPGAAALDKVAPAQRWA